MKETSSSTICSVDGVRFAYHVVGGALLQIIRQFSPHTLDLLLVDVHNGPAEIIPLLRKPAGPYFASSLTCSLAGGKDRLMKVELERGVWLTDGDGDPSRTLKKENATEYETINDALMALKKAREFRPFPNAQIGGSMF